MAQLTEITIPIEKYIILRTKAWHNSSRKNRFHKRAKKELGNKCFICGTSENITVHHLKSVSECFKSNQEELIQDINNVILACRECHKDIHRGV